MSTQKLAKQLIKQFESLRLVPYYCPAGRKTIGYGHAIKPHEQAQLDSEITKEQAERLLDEDVKQVQMDLSRYCHVHLTVNQKAALISFIFNCGSAAFRNSTLLKRLNEGKYAEAADQFLRWVFVKDKELKGLVKRRKLERAIFLGEVDLCLLSVKYNLMLQSKTIPTTAL
ncbi:lysozyme [Rickettsia endosymbiont of Ceutorhynchus obstrictus]|uniref:lysozyme n=1 Tax=Rickettsia endosymbiont of Ceutorhynchus obstrictus TaxID=3066249 RepID=UPI003132D952